LNNILNLYKGVVRTPQPLTLKFTIITVRDKQRSSTTA